MTLGERIHHYLVTARLGSGGMGEVYRAEDQKLGREIALKLLPDEFARDRYRRQRFLTEARAASVLNHPNVCTIYEVGETDGGRPYIAMELVEGRTLDRLERPDMDLILSIALQMADALDAAHSKGIIHRDIKPANVLLDDERHVKVLDFGLAKRLMSEDHSDPEGSTQFETKEGRVLGTPNYMSPEQALGRELDHRSDLFSFGIVLYQLITGQLPFEGATVGDTTDKIVNQTPESMARLNYDLPVEMERIILKCLEKRADDRYQTAKELEIDLRRLKQSDSDLATDRSSALARQNVRPRRPLMATWGWPMAAVFIIGLLFWFGFKDGSEPVSSSDNFRIAVLPLANFSSDPADAYFADGMTEELISKISNLRGLRVIARSSIMRYKNSEKDIAEIGREIGVGTVLDGSVRKEGNQLRISFQLVDVATQENLWVKDYQRLLKNVFEIQSEVAFQVAAALQVQLMTNVRQKLHRPATSSMEAYQLYLEGLFYWNQRMKEGLERAMELFNQAIEADPMYAQAHAGLAASFVLYPGFANEAHDAWLAKAKASARKALEFDPDLSLAYAALGFAAQVERDWDAAEQAYQQAMTLNPNDVVALHWYSALLVDTGRLVEAQEANRQLLDLDPLSAIALANKGFILYFLGEYQRSVDQYLDTLRVYESFSRTHLFLGLAYQMMGRSRESIDVWKKYRGLLKNESPDGLGHLGYAYAKGGDTEAVQVILNELTRLAGEGRSAAYEIALVHYGLGDHDRVFDWLQQAADERNWWMRVLKVNPLWEPLRDDPRYSELLARIGLQGN